MVEGGGGPEAVRPRSASWPVDSTIRSKGDFKALTPIEDASN
jgi:hypothetical protein